MVIRDQLRQEWFARLEQIRAVCEHLPLSGLQCLTQCSALCCPRVKMRSMRRSEIASPVVVLLPFEMEFIMHHVGAGPELFREMPIEIETGVTIAVGLLDLAKPCAFLRSDFRCGIYDRRPLDCRTFPLLPRLASTGKLSWSYGENCPSLSSLNPAFDDQIRSVWDELNHVLPAAWWELYRKAESISFSMPEESSVPK